MIAQSTRRILIAAAIFLAVAGLSGCAGAPTSQPETNRQGVAGTRASSAVGERAVSIALQQVGAPYRYGGQGPSTFDCSGLVHYSYLKAGRAVPRTTRLLWQNTRAIRRTELEKGDLLFFSIEGKMQHVGLYIGNDRFVHSPSTGKQVSVASLESTFYERAFLRGGRLR